MSGNHRSDFREPVADYFQIAEDPGVGPSITTQLRFSLPSALPRQETIIGCMYSVI
jgi:hypothetical protein